MLISLFALAHSEFGIGHFTTDFILVVAFAFVTALPMSFLRPKIKEWEQAGVMSPVFKSNS
tara:strand:- start:51726 stop:51908 length:183 start_codon:yes stop_codon:yes gene_type:complete